MTRSTVPEEAYVSFATTPTVLSGKPYEVLEVAGRTPSDLTDFVDADRFTMDMEGEPYLVCGCGSLVDDEVRFHEKDMAHDGKDVRVWRLSRHPDGGFLAEHAAAF